MSKSASKPSLLNDLRLLFGISLADFFDDAFQSACITMAIASVLAPILVLFGLREGVVENLRSTMVEDPVYREVIPARTQDYSNEFFDALSTREDVAFVLPSILAGASIISARSTDTGKLGRPNLIPTAEGDPVLEVASLEDVLPSEIVISTPLARELELKVGASLELMARRSVDGRSESVSEVFRISGVLPLQSEGRQAILAPADFVYDVERYREGFARPARGWPGEVARPRPVFNGVFVFSDREIAPEALSLAKSYSALTGQAEFDLERFRSLTGLGDPVGEFALELFAEGSTFDSDSLDILNEELRRFGAGLFPYVEGRQVWVSAPGADEEPTMLSVVTAPTNANAYQRAQLPPPWVESFMNATGPPTRSVILPEALGSPDLASAASIGLGMPGWDTTLTVPFTVLGQSAPAGLAIMPPEISGLVNAAALRPSVYDELADAIVLVPEGYRGFRLYARSIEDVAEIVSVLEAQGIPVRSRERAIARVQSIDVALMALFMIIVTLGVISGIMIVSANVFALVRRRVRDLGMLRLLGFSKSTLYLYPVIHAVLANILAFVLAVLTYFLIGFYVDQTLAERLGFGDGLISLNMVNFYVALGFSFAIVIGAGLLGGAKVLSIEPREALRDE